MWYLMAYQTLGLCQMNCIEPFFVIVNKSFFLSLQIQMHIKTNIDHLDTADYSLVSN